MTINQSDKHDHPINNAINKVIDITTAELPLHCPLDDKPAWNQHPRVFLPIATTANGIITCPYCSAVYQLIK